VGGRQQLLQNSRRHAVSCLESITAAEALILVEPNWVSSRLGLE
jgi:hypothetical protein